MRRRASLLDHVASISIHAILAGASLFAVAPLLWALVTSLKTQDVIVTYPPAWLPNPVTLENYALVVNGSNMPRYFFNSLIVAGATIVISLVIAAHGGYAAARFTFPGKNVLLFIILATVMIPGIAVLVPLYLTASYIGLHDTYWVLILIYSAWQIPTVLWLMRGFFESVPSELDEAALIDGCTPLQAFYRVVLPLTQPGLAAAAILVFVNVWNEFLIALALTASDHMRLVTTGLYYYVTAFGVEWGKLMAAVVLAIVPGIVLFVPLQRRFVQGLIAGASKG